MENVKTYEGFLSSLLYGIKKAAGDTKPDDDIADRILKYLKTHPLVNIRYNSPNDVLRKYVDYSLDINQDRDPSDPFGEESSGNSINISANKENRQSNIYLNGEKIECSSGMANSIYDKMKDNYNNKERRERKENDKIREEDRRRRMEEIKNNLKF